jgi:hypothetical protein
MIITQDGDARHHDARHHTLLSHFFHSVKALLRRRTQAAPTESSSTHDVPPQCHVTLCANMPERWGLVTAAERAGFRLAHEMPPTRRRAFLPEQHWCVNSVAQRVTLLR